MNIAIVGAGWAGLAAAMQAADLGHQVTVFEAAHTLGGRARRVHSKRLNAVIDNGQHILLGAYTDTLALMQRLGLETNQQFLQEPLNIESANGKFKLQLAQAPAPLHLLFGLIRAKGISILERLRMALAINALKKQNWLVNINTTVADWLAQNKQSRNICQNFWYPLCVAAMNTPPEVACAQLFANVLRDSLGGTAQASNTLIAKVDLSDLWADHVAHAIFVNNNSNIKIETGATVRSLILNDADASTDGWQTIEIHNQKFDAVILACNVPSTLRLLQSLNDSSTPSNAENTAQKQQLINSLSLFHYMPIATLNLRLKQAWPLPRAMYLLNENRAKGHYGQWLFNCSSFLNNENNHNIINVVISDANEAIHRSEDALVESVCLQLAKQAKRFGKMPDVEAHELIVEKRATFAATPSLPRPLTQTPWPSIWLAGDYTNTSYPAVLEGAVRSGRQAALGLHNSRAK